MLLQVILEGLGLGALLVLVCAVGICKGAVGMVHLYSPAVQQRCVKLTPALCHLDYTMSEAGGVTDFVRQYTLASGGPCCDCGYKKKG